MRHAALALVGLVVIGCGNEAPASSSASASAAPPRASASGSANPAAQAPVLPPLKVGDRAPDVTLTLADGKTVGLSSLKGKLVLVYFYPEDETKGCTIEAESIRDSSKDFEAAGVDVYGVSMQGAESHKSFADKHSLKFALVTDEDGKIATAFHVPHDEKHAKRQSFLIGKDGTIAAEWLDVDPSKHAADVLAAAAKAAPLTLEVRPNGDIFLAGAKVEKPADLVSKLKDAVAKNPDVELTIVADASVQHGKVVEVIDRVKEAGVKKMVMSVPSAAGSATPSATITVPPTK